MAGFYYEGNYYACGRVSLEVFDWFPSYCYRTFADDGGLVGSIAFSGKYLIGDTFDIGGIYFSNEEKSSLAALIYKKVTSEEGPISPKFFSEIIGNIEHFRQYWHFRRHRKTNIFFGSK